MAPPNIRELYDNARGPSFLLRLKGFGHNSITDGPVRSPDAYGYAIDPQRALHVFDSLIGGLMEATLGGESYVLPKISEVTVKGEKPVG